VQELVTVHGGGRVQLLWEQSPFHLNRYIKYYLLVTYTSLYEAMQDEGVELCFIFHNAYSVLHVYIILPEIVLHNIISL